MIEFDKLQFKVVEESKGYGKFEIGPLPRGFGHTFANPLRRTLLSSLSGSGFTGVKINGVKHEFATIEGVSEEVLQIMLNLKELNLRSHSANPVVLKLTASGKGEVKASDFEPNAEIEIGNPDHVVANLSDGAKLDLEATVENGVGYVLADSENRSTVGQIPMDTNFSPVRRVKFDIVAARVGRRTDFDKAIVEIFVNDLYSPSESLQEAAEILVKMYAKVLGESEVVQRILENSTAEEVEEEENVEEEVADISVDDLGLSARALNSLKNSGVSGTKTLIEMTKDELEALDGMGKKSLDDVEKALAKQGLGLKDA